MPDAIAILTEILGRAGFPTEAPSPRRLAEADSALRLAESDARACAARLLSAERKQAQAERTCRELMEALDEQRETLEELLGARAVLCRLEGLHRSVRGDEDGGEWRAVVMLGQQRCEVGIEESISIERLNALEPWHFVLVHPEERILLGVLDHPALKERARGSLAAFREHVDEETGQVVVVKPGHEERVVTLARSLRGRALPPDARLVLLEGDERYAIDVVARDTGRSRFVIPPEALTTRLEDLAGLDDLIGQLERDAELRFVRPEVAARFDGKPWRGIVLHSAKPGMAKTALVRAYGRYLVELGQRHGFDVLLYQVKPGELKNLYHGEDARIVREELCGPLRAAAARPRDRALFQVVVLDEIDCLGRRTNELHSAAQNDATLALLAELDGLVRWDAGADNAPAHLLWIGLTNRLEGLDVALQRPGRFADLVQEMPDLTPETVVGILRAGARSADLPWWLEGEVRTGLSTEELVTRLLRPAVAEVFPATVMRIHAEGRGVIAARAGECLSGAHCEAAMNDAKRRAAGRALARVGLEAVALEDLLDALLEQACAAARQLDSDRATLARLFGITTRITRVELSDANELAAHRYVDLAS